MDFAPVFDGFDFAQKLVGRPGFSLIFLSALFWEKAFELP
jgi:hypothetical protein